MNEVQETGLAYRGVDDKGNAKLELTIDNKTVTHYISKELWEAINKSFKEDNLQWRRTKDAAHFVTKKDICVALTKAAQSPNASNYADFVEDCGKMLGYFDRFGIERINFLDTMLGEANKQFVKKLKERLTALLG